MYTTEPIRRTVAPRIAAIVPTRPILRVARDQSERERATAENDREAEERKRERRDREQTADERTSARTPRLTRSAGNDATEDDQRGNEAEAGSERERAWVDGTFIVLTTVGAEQMVDRHRGDGERRGDDSDPALSRHARHRLQ